MEEIKISELSIGDWVVLENQPFKVIGINPPYVDLLGNGNRLRLSDIDNDNLSLIPLTPEILEKNGISKTYESDEYAVYKGEGFNVTEYYTELWEFEKHRNRLMLRNVHQLQHALRLAGVGKEIKL